MPRVSSIFRANYIIEAAPFIRLPEDIDQLKILKIEKVIVRVYLIEINLNVFAQDPVGRGELINRYSYFKLICRSAAGYYLINSLLY